MTKDTLTDKEYKKLAKTLGIDVEILKSMDLDAQLIRSQFKQASKGTKRGWFGGTGATVAGFGTPVAAFEAIGPSAAESAHLSLMAGGSAICAFAGIVGSFFYSTIKNAKAHEKIKAEVDTKIVDVTTRNPQFGKASEAPKPGFLK